jgi:hypothetical protein
LTPPPQKKQQLADALPLRFYIHATADGFPRSS